MDKVRDFEEESSHYGRTESKPLYNIINIYFIYLLSSKANRIFIVECDNKKRHDEP